ncbi:DNA-binding protein [Escherichia coli]|uniref:DNA-binding protein n=1 Tax=Escherichia coli TaxID=562 RepID=A0A377BUK9_ECOLX|nr:DNA-binding protein [Escherichia coli]
MPSRSPARAWRSFLISRPIIVKTVCSAWNDAFYRVCAWVRMAKARMILQKYHLSIHEVAQRCGFPDSDYFCRVFRRQFGLTPGEYSARFQGLTSEG